MSLFYAHNSNDSFLAICESFFQIVKIELLVKKHACL